MGKELIEYYRYQINIAELTEFLRNRENLSQEDLSNKVTIQFAEETRNSGLDKEIIGISLSWSKIRNGKDNSTQSP